MSERTHTHPPLPYSCHPPRCTRPSPSCDTPVHAPQPPQPPQPSLAPDRRFASLRNYVHPPAAFPAVRLAGTGASTCTAIYCRPRLRRRHCWCDGDGRTEFGTSAAGTRERIRHAARESVSTAASPRVNPCYSLFSRHTPPLVGAGDRSSLRHQPASCPCFFAYLNSVAMYDRAMLCFSAGPWTRLPVRQLPVATNAYTSTPLWWDGTCFMGHGIL